jgi:hypothetical protein
MPQAPVPDEPVLPRWLVVIGSAVILFHLTAIIIPVLDVPSGPWFGPEPEGKAPKFVESARDLTTMHTDGFRVAHSFHFASNQPANNPGVEFAVLLKDEQGNVIETLHFPDPNANLWVRQRQEVLASSLAPDRPVQPPGSEVIAPVGAEPPRVTIWKLPQERRAGDPPLTESVDGKKVQLWVKNEVQNQLPRDRGMLYQPSEWSEVLVRSYARYLCRSHGAARAEVVRLTRENIPPFALFGRDTPPEAYHELVATFGEKTSEELNKPLGKKSR